MKYCLSSIIAATIATTTITTTTTATATATAVTTIATATIAATAATITATIYVVASSHASSFPSFFIALPLITTLLLIVPEQTHSAAAAAAAVAAAAAAAVTEHRSPPDLSIPSQTEFRVPVGTKQFRLICPVKEKNDDLLMIQWKKNDEPIGFDFNNHFKLARSDRELKIRNPQLSDGGIYQCQVVNGFGHRELNFTVTFYDPAVENEENTDSTLTLTTNAGGGKGRK